VTLPARYDLDVYRGDTFRRTFTFWTDTDLTVPWDLTGVAFAAELREQTGSPVVAALVVTVELPNVVRVLLPAEDSAGLEPSHLGWDLQATYEGTVRTVLAGDVTVEGDYTDSDYPADLAGAVLRNG
jgi:hypothetical protein